MRDGKECATDAECLNACVSEPCNKDSLEDSGDCGGVCGTLTTVEYEPPADSGNSMVSTTAKRRLSAKTTRRAKCPSKIWNVGQVCHRFGWHRRCRNNNRCSWRLRVFKHPRGGRQVKWCGVCVHPPARPIFNCALFRFCWLHARFEDVPSDWLARDFVHGQADCPVAVKACTLCIVSQMLDRADQARERALSLTLQLHTICVYAG